MSHDICLTFSWIFTVALSLLWNVCCPQSLSVHSIPTSRQPFLMQRELAHWWPSSRSGVLISCLPCSASCLNTSSQPVTCAPPCSTPQSFPTAPSPAHQHPKLCVPPCLICEPFHAHRHQSTICATSRYSMTECSSSGTPMATSVPRLGRGGAHRVLLPSKFSDV